MVLKVPAGTEILDETQDEVIADLTTVGQRVVLAEGGNGGFGNLHFKSSTNRAPRTANPGLPGIDRTLWLRLKLIADVGLLGLPNAGKSTFLAAVSNARPKIADYPFTTLHPNLGVVPIDGTEIVIADIPGLIEGAHEGKGIGDRFLGHVERCSALLHIVDGTSEDPVADYKVILREIEKYPAALLDKPRVTVVNKLDAGGEDYMRDVAAELAAAGAEAPLVMSGVSGAGVQDVLRALRALIDARVAADNAPLTEAPWRP